MNWTATFIPTDVEFSHVMNEEEGLLLGISFKAKADMGD